MRILATLCLVASSALAIPPAMTGAGTFNPAAVPGTVAVLDGGKRMVWDGTGYITSWASKGTITGTVPLGAAVMPADGQVIGVHGSALTTGLTATVGSLPQPFTAYCLVAPKDRSQVTDAITLFFQHQTSTPSVRYRIMGKGTGTGVTISADSGRFRTAPDFSIAGPTVSRMTWLRIRAVWNGASSSLLVEDTDYTGNLPATYGQVNGDVIQQGMYVAYWHVISGLVSAADHARIWSHMTQLKRLLPDYARAVDARPVTAGGYAAFGSVSRTAGGTLVATYRVGTTHVTIDGVIQMQTSADTGATWTAPATIYTPAAGWDARGGEVTVLSSGRWIVSFFDWNGLTTPGSRVPHTIYSDDSGATWSSPSTITPTTPMLWLATSGMIEELPSGDLLLPTYGEPNPTTNRKAVFFRSTDQGATWAEDSVVPIAGRNVDEPVLHRLADGRVLALLRSSDSNYKAFAADSTATPLVWGTPTFAFMGDAEPHFVQRASGEIVAATRGYAAYRLATGAQVFVTYRSTDAGATWSGPHYPHPHWHGFMYACPIEIGGVLYAFWYVEGNVGSSTFVYWETI